MFALGLILSIKVDEKTNKRKRMQGFDLELVDVSRFGVPDLFQRFVSRERAVRKNKQNLADHNKEANAKIASNKSDRGAECHSALRVFFKFVEITLHPKTMDLRYLFEERVLHGWTAFYSGHVSSPSSAGNYAKCLAQFMTYLQVTTKKYLSVVNVLLTRRVFLFRLWILSRAILHAWVNCPNSFTDFGNRQNTKRPHNWRHVVPRRPCMSWACG